MWKAIAALAVLAALVGGYFMALMHLAPVETPIFGMQRRICGPNESCRPQPQTLEDYLDGSVLVLVGRVDTTPDFIVEEVLKGRVGDTIVSVGRQAHTVRVPPFPSERYLVTCHWTSLDVCRYAPFILDGPVARFNDQRQSPVYLHEPGHHLYAPDPYTVPPGAFTVSPDDFIERIRDIVDRQQKVFWNFNLHQLVHLSSSLWLPRVRHTAGLFLLSWCAHDADRGCGR